jgi:hypothetical protein
MRVARWNGSTWLDIGRHALDQIVDAQGQTTARDLSIASDRKGGMWLLRRASKQRGSELAIARWDGTEWTAVPSPGGPQSKDPNVWSASMIVRNDAPIVAWSQADASENHYLYVSEWSAGNRWTARISGLHLVEGFSNVTDVKLALGAGHSLLVSWDEPGKDKRSTRMVQAYACAAGEMPLTPPASIVERDTWPTTVDQAARQIAGALNEESKALVRGTKKEELFRYNFDWGMGIRNALGLWRGNDKLLDSCGNGTKADPESCSAVIIEAVWTVLQAPKL